MKTTKTKIKLKSLLLAVAASFISLTVVMSAAHAKDLVKDHSHDAASMARTVDPVARAIGDLHNHTDKQTLKAISMDNPVTARQREINALQEEKETRNFLQILEDVLIFYRLTFALRFSLAVA